MVDADGATDIKDVVKLLDSLKKIEKIDVSLGGVVGIAVGSRYLILF